MYCGRGLNNYTLTKIAFAEKLMNEQGLTKDEAKNLVELFFGEIKDILE